MNPNELLTKQDLEMFRKELLELLKPLVDNRSLQSQKWLRSKDVRQLLNISTGTLQSLRISGAIKFKQVGGIYFYKADDIDQALNSTEKKSPLKKS